MSAFRIEIPEPCSESWEGMTPTACGRFCNRCQKEVIDISQMDDETILQKYVENGGQLCINARADQITPTRITSEVRVRSFRYARLALFALALWTIFSGGLVREVFAQQKTTSTVQTQSTDSRLDVTVKDENDNPVYEARITVIQGIDFVTGTTTDAAGIGRIESIDPGEYRLKISSLCNDTLFNIRIEKGKLHELTVKMDCVEEPEPKQEPNKLSIEELRQRVPRRGIRGGMLMRPAGINIGTETGKITRRYAFDLQGNSWWEERE